MDGQDSGLTLIPLEKCKKGRVYRLNSRNLRYGVFDGKTGFIGIRQKWEDRYLFREYHWDADPRHGTVRAMEDTGIDVPETVEIKESLGTKDQISGRPMEYRDDAWVFTDTEEKASGDYSPMGVRNSELFDFLVNVEQRAKNAD